NIYSGGGDRSLEYQIQTFKALCENAAFEAESGRQVELSNGNGDGSDRASGPTSGVGGQSSEPAIHINLHIHLPENKSRRDYEDIIEDIGRYIFGRQISSSRE